MRKTIAALAVTLGFALPIHASAESGDVDAKIKSINVGAQTIMLDDGKEYHTPSEFNYEGLEPGVAVTIYYSEEDGKRVIDDLIVDE